MRIPKYRRHSARDLGFVAWKGKRHYLPGRHGSSISRQAYREFLFEHVLPFIEPSTETLTIDWLCTKYLGFASGYYGSSTSEYGSIKAMGNVVVAASGDKLAREFTTLDLIAVREAMIAKGWVRTSINHYVQRVRRMFSWGVEQMIVPVSVADALRHVAPLRAGKTAAKESEPVTAVDRTIVEATIQHLPQILADMVRLHLLTGMRSDQLVRITPGQIDQSPTQLDDSSTLWIYTPASHKSQWRGKELLIPLGPKAQAIITPYLERADDAPLFSPAESMRQYHASRTRKTPVQPSQKIRGRKKKPLRTPGKQYNSRSYQQAIARACDKAGLPHWHPHQLRHTVATEVRAEFGLEASQVALGHAHASVTQIYAERDLKLACRLAQERG